MVAGGELGPPLADGFDDPGAFVPADDGQRGRVAGADVLVRVAETGVGEADQDLARLRRGEFEFGDLPVLAGCGHDGGTGLHQGASREVGDKAAGTEGGSLVRQERNRGQERRAGGGRLGPGRPGRMQMREDRGPQLGRKRGRVGGKFQDRTCPDRILT
jgi:hypothetical protein